MPDISQLVSSTIQLMDESFNVFLNAASEVFTHWRNFSNVKIYYQLLQYESWYQFSKGYLGRRLVSNAFANTADLWPDTVGLTGTPCRSLWALQSWTNSSSISHSGPVKHEPAFSPDSFFRLSWSPWFAQAFLYFYCNRANNGHRNTRYALYYQAANQL